ncbi:MAG TPA: class I SAM-dependent RNA methyltransferase [Verrucomicrobiae bacterium]
MSLKIGDQITLNIHDLAFGGEGVGRLDDFVVFVPFTITGETVEAQIIEVKKNFARAKLLRVTVLAPERTQPECRYYTQCGGCQYQHIDYAAQLRFKHKQIADLFERVGKIPADRIAPVLPCPQPYAYRNRIMIRSQWNGPAKKMEIGFIRADNNFVETIEECRIAEPSLNEQIRQVQANPPPRGGLKFVLRVQPEGWVVPKDSFFQNNFFLLPGLVDTVKRFLAAGQTRQLIDLYCGVGFFGIEAASAVDRFVGVEYDALAIKAARENAKLRGLTNGEFIAAKSEDALPGLLKQFPAENTAVLLDPPRKGCWPSLLELLRTAQPAQVIYVSCHPATMARDLNILCGDGVFELVQVQPLDMFPQTQHVECVADLRKRK